MPTAKAALKSQKPTLDEFRAAVRYLLVNDYGMPELVADETLNIDAQYVQNAYDESGLKDSSISDVADELAIKPRENREWVKVDSGQLIVTINDSVDGLLKRLANTGLYGDSIPDVAAAMLRRGIEAVLPALSLDATSVRR
ncbi:hypothetical protein [Cupriavidus metallidurans]|uniref:hypothetical protein n=1 Tax=Cupriavidus metallidurans TaxID=119219 RepID=UPI000CE02F19|nr:hypothetical protein [Cupriavidus metallidurans]AVA38248.1 hypothetical protein C3Z06_32095 [Cupriavidus metallidurans]